MNHGFIRLSPPILFSFSYSQVQRLCQRSIAVVAVTVVAEDIAAAERVEDILHPALGEATRAVEVPHDIPGGAAYAAVHAVA